MPRTADDYRRHLDTETLSRIASLELRARTIVEGYLAGMHRSPYRGSSVDFVQHRPYTQGDDLRHLDWKVFGRTDKLYVKQYAQDTNLACVLLVDGSESMSYVSAAAAGGARHDSGSDGKAGILPKYDYASTLAACLAYLALQQGDAVGIGVFDEAIRRWVRPSSQGSAWSALVQTLDQAAGGRRTGLGAVLEDVSGRLERRCLIVLVSDLLDDPDETLRGLRQIRSRGHDVIVLHVLDADELRFPFRGPTDFQGLEGAGHMSVDPLILREQYLGEMHRFLEALRTRCRGLLIDYELLATDVPLEVALSRYLAMRCASMSTL